MLRITMTAGAGALVLALVGLAGAPGAAQAVPAARLTPPPTPTPEPSHLPYPAYGTPAPDVAQSRAVAGVPTSVSLAQAMAIAVSQSPVFAGQRAQYDVARAKYASEKLAIFPSVSANAGATRSYGSSVTRTGSGGTGNNSTTGNGPFTTLSATAQLQQLIFDGGRVIAAIKSAKQSDLAGRQTLERQLQALEFNVAKAFYGVLQANAAVDASAQSVHQFEITENSISAKIRAGAAARSDLSLAQFQTARARGQLVSVQGQAIAAQSAFASTLGLDADTAIAPQGNGQNGAIETTPTYQKSLGQALLMRPDYLAAQHAVEAASENVRFAKLARFPVLNGTASDGVSKTLPSQTSFSHSASLGAALSIPIFDQGLTNFNVANAQSQLDQANAGLILSKLTVESDVRSALSGLISARALRVQAQLELQSAQVSLSAAQAKYKVGVATILDLVTAEANYAQAQTDYVNAVYGTGIAEQTFSFALGLTDLKGPPP